MHYISNTSTTSCCGAPITNDSYSCNIFCTRYDTSLYGDFLNSFDKIKDKSMLMFHSPLEINQASKLFRNYLTDEELQEKQYKGRFWTIDKLSYINQLSTSNYFTYYLYILVDNETLVIVDTKGETKISGREYLPTSLQGRYYYDEC